MVWGGERVVAQALATRERKVVLSGRRRCALHADGAPVAPQARAVDGRSIRSGIGSA